MIIINIAKDYSMTPGGRFAREGRYSGEDFRKTILKPQYLKARENNEQLQVNLDGGFGYATSFLEEAFGGLVRDLGESEIGDIEIISDEEPELIEKIKNYIEEALQEKRGAKK